ncbi:MAG: hypothetical protein ORN27_02030 [Rhodoluna sp.]|nr:hypothetical protein [Rhodoluna sp.]
MSKNLTRKGLAFGALIALGTSLIAGAPANAIGEDGNVTLAPNAGTEYSVLAGSTFDLKANYSNAVAISGHNLKFLVTDTAATSKFDLDVNGSTSDVNTAGAFTAWTQGAGSSSAKRLITVTAAAHGLKVGDSVVVGGATDTDASSDATFLALVNTTQTVLAVTDADTFTFEVTSTGPTVTPGVTSGTLTGSLTNGLQAANTIAGKALGSHNTISTTASVGARKADNSYVINTGTANFNTSNTVLRLINTDPTTSATYTVTAWVDDNGDGLVDANESKSPVRTVKFLTNADITTTTTLRPVAVGDSTLTADVVTSPVLNGDQVSASSNPGYADALAVDFNRQDSSKTLRATAGSTAWNDTTKTWTVVSANMNDTSGADYVGNTGSGTAGWAISQPVAQTAAGTNKVAIKAHVVTITTTVTHNLKVGDRVVVASSTANTRVNSDTTATSAFSTVTSVPTSTSFTFTELSTTATTDIAEVADSAVTVAVTGGETKILRNFVVAGTYSAQAKLASYTALVTSAFASAGAKASAVAGAKVASAIALTGSGSTVSKDGLSIKAGTTSATVLATVKNVDGDAVGAGVDVSIAATASSIGTVTLNDTKLGTSSVTVYGKTDANGQIKLVFANSSAVADESVTYTVTSQGVSTSSTTSTWKASVFSIINLDDQTAVGDARNVVAVTGGTATLNLLVQDQFLQAADSATYRLVVANTGRTVSTSNVALTAGKATVAVADGSLGSGTTTSVSISFQKLVSGTWTDVDSATYHDWAGATASDDLAVVTINWIAATAVNKLTLNADGANLPSSVSADFAASTTLATIAALDGRVSNATAPAVLAAEKAVVSGKVTDSVSSVARAGVVVTVSGTGLLFKSGDVWSIGSASVLSNDGTFSVEVYSASAGEKVVTVAVGAVTKTATVTFTGLGASKTNVLKAAAGATTVQAGRAVDYTATVVDKQGNAVEGFALKATLTGAGYFAGSVNADGTASVSTDKYGKAVVKVLFSSADQGTATVTFSDNDASTATADNLASVVLATEVGSTDAQIDIVGKRVTAVTSFSKGKTVAFYVDGIKKWSKISSSDADVVLSYNLKKGAHTVTVKVSGGFVTTEKFIVK